MIGDNVPVAAPSNNPCPVDFNISPTEKPSYFPVSGFTTPPVATCSSIPFNVLNVAKLAAPPATPCTTRPASVPAAYLLATSVAILPTAFSVAFSATLPNIALPASPRAFLPTKPPTPPETYVIGSSAMLATVPIIFIALC